VTGRDGAVDTRQPGPRDGFLDAASDRTMIDRSSEDGFQEDGNDDADADGDDSDDGG
jgi:hypothetical protein